MIKNLDSVVFTVTYIEVVLSKAKSVWTIELPLFRPFATGRSNVGAITEVEAVNLAIVGVTDVEGVIPNGKLIWASVLWATMQR